MSVGTKKKRSGNGLVFSRRKHESFLIDGGIRVTVISGDCRLLIEAPQHVTVVRSELLDQSQKIPDKLPRISQKESKLRSTQQPAPAA